MTLYSQTQVSAFIEKQRPWINSIATKYRITAAAICAILHIELERMDALDIFADYVVATQLFPKKDSSTGPMQIYGRVGLQATAFAVERGLTSYRALGLPENPSPHQVWKVLHRNVHANIEIAALNLLLCAQEMTGRIDFSSYTPSDMKLIFTRYNQDTRRITAYGETAYRYYLFYSRIG